MVTLYGFVDPGVYGTGGGGGGGGGGGDNSRQETANVSMYGMGGMYLFLVNLGFHVGCWMWIFPSVTVHRTYDSKPLKTVDFIILILVFL